VVEQQHLQLEAEAMEVMALVMDVAVAEVEQPKAAATAATAAMGQVELLSSQPTFKNIDRHCKLNKGQTLWQH
jgi:hypothetical protein